jgi:hypothetical protein
MSKVGTGTVTFQKSEPEQKKIVTVPQHWEKYTYQERGDNEKLKTEKQS